HEHVGERGLFAAQAIADRAWPRPGRARSDARLTGRVVDADDGTAAGADGDHFYLGGRVVEAVHHGFSGVFDFAVLDDADFEGGAAHVDRNNVRLVQQLSQRLAADHPGSRPTFEHADRTVAGFARR